MSKFCLPQVRNPFPGLRPFREDEEHLFFGRESQLHTMIDRLSATRFLAIVGTSGSGKSSLVNCGLRPALHRGLLAKAGSSWRMVQFRPGSNPLQAMARALAKDGVLFHGFDSATLSLEDIVEASLRMSKLGLSRVYEDAHLSEGSNLLVVVDQFEELFRYRGLESSATSGGQHRSQEAAAFVNVLLEPSAHSRAPIYVVLTMRSDFLGDAAEFAGLPEAINDGQYLVPRLTREERRAAIAAPVGVGGANISPVLLTRLVNDVGDNPDQLSILQHALNRTWARWEHEGCRQGPLDLWHYEAIGTMAHALDQHAEKAYAELGDERHRKICEKIFKALTDKGRGVRRPTKFGTLCRLAEAGAQSAAHVIDVFRKPSRSFLMPPLPETLEQDRVIDISHESLMRVWERLKVWTEEEVQSSRLYRRVSETAALHATGRAGLWDDPDLQFALDWKQKERPTEAWAELYGGAFDQAMTFLAESQDRRDKESWEKEETRQRELRQAQELAAERQRRIEEQVQAARRLKLRLVALRVVAAFLFVIGVFAGIEARNARKAGDEVKSANTKLKKSIDSLQQKDRQLEESNESLRTWSQRTREERLQNAGTIAVLADELIQHRTPEQSVPWLKQRGNALLELRNLDEAESSLNESLDLAPGDEYARTTRGYLYLLKDDPKSALIDFKYIRDKINPKSPLNYLNLSIAQAQLGEHKAAQTSAELAVKNFLPTQFPGGVEDEVSPHITLATGRPKLVANAEAFELALLYMRANLDAYVGAADFVDHLHAADHKARGLPRTSRDDAYLTALNWAWLQLRVRPKDYGALASQAYLWQKAGYQEWGWCYYEEFQDEHKRMADGRYVNLAKWVEANKTKPSDLPPSFSCRGLRETKKDSLTLEVEALENEARQQYRKAEENLDLALAKDPDNIRLLLEKADVLYQLGTSEKNDGKYQQRLLERAKERLKSYEDESADEQNGLQELGRNKEANVKKAEEASDAKYAKLIFNERRQIDAYQVAWQRVDGLEKQDFRKLKDDCKRILATARVAPRAHFYQALADYELSGGSTVSDSVLKDLKISLKGDPTNLDTLYWLSAFTAETKPEQALGYVAQYIRLSPGYPAMYSLRAKLEIREKRYANALHSIETAIAMEPDNLDNYEIRAEAQRAMGFTESRVQRMLAIGYRQAANLLEKEGKTDRAKRANEKSWVTLAKIAETNANEEVRCDPGLTTCTFSRMEKVKSEWVFAGIESIGSGSGNEREVKIDRGVDDGMVVGQEGEIWSPLKRDEGPDRPIMRLGTGEILSAESHSALVRVKMDSPNGDGLVQKHDCIRLKALTRPHSKESRLWPLVTYNITIEDSKGNTIVDYQTLYSRETPELEMKLMQTMLDDLHEFGRAYGDNLAEKFFKGKTISKGTFEGKTVRQAMEDATLEDLNKSLDFALKYPGEFFGNKWRTGIIYLVWTMAGN